MQSTHYGQETGRKIVIHVQHNWDPTHQEHQINLFISARRLVNPQTVQLPEAPRGFALDYTDLDVLLYLDLSVLQDVIRRAHPFSPDRFLLFCAPPTAPEVSEALGAADDNGRILLTSDNVGAVVHQAALNYQPSGIPMYLQVVPR